jgi:phage-related protein
MTQPSGDEFAPEIMGLFRAGSSALQQGLAGIKKAWDDLINRINALLAAVQHELNSDSIWSSISEWFTSKIEDAVKKIQEVVEQIRQKVDQVLTAVQKAVNGSIPVGSLFEVGLDWGTKVNTPLSDMSPDMTGSGKIDSWRGPAKLTYEKRVEDQIDAVDNTVDKVKATSSWLADVAQANTAYMVSLGERASDVVGALVAVVIDGTETASGAITQVVITLQHCSELIGTAVTQIQDYLLNLANRLADVVKQITTLADEYGDHRGLPQGHWPQPVNS